MKKYIYAAAVAMTISLAGCESIDELPPIMESTSGKSYRIHEPEPMNSQDYAAFDAIRKEYDEATKK